MKDMMAGFALYQPSDLDNALSLADHFKERGWIYAGGNDSLDWFKDRIKRPEAVIDISGIDALKGVRELGGGLEIGPLTTLTELQHHPLVTERFGLLAQAASRVASPQIRNTATLGGNLGQDARCWYYRSGLDCYRAGGNTCYADTPRGMNREHCIFGANRCVAVSPSDTAPVLIALDAECVIDGGSGERALPAEEFFIGPATDITRMTVLQPGEILTSIRIPPHWAGASFYFEKVADRNSWDFSLVNIAAAMKIDGDTVADLRIAAGGVECKPRRLTVVEEVVRGNARSDALGEIAASAASRGATPLNHNGYKIPLLENLVKRALREA